MNTTTRNNENGEPVVLPVDLRDYFAIHARHEDLHFVVSGGGSTAKEAADYIGITEQEYTSAPWKYWQAVVSKARYEFADAMIEARGK